MGEKRTAYKVLLSNPEGKRPLPRPGRRSEDNIKMDLKEIGWVLWTGFIWLGIESSGGLL
jgi:hypothetical protein